MNTENTLDSLTEELSYTLSELKSAAMRVYIGVYPTENLPETIPAEHDDESNKYWTNEDLGYQENPIDDLQDYFSAMVLLKNDLKDRAEEYFKNLGEKQKKEYAQLIRELQELEDRCTDFITYIKSLNNGSGEYKELTKHFDLICSTDDKIDGTMIYLTSSADNEAN